MEESPLRLRFTNVHLHDLTLHELAGYLIATISIYVQIKVFNRARKELGIQSMLIGLLVLVLVVGPVEFAFDWYFNFPKKKASTTLALAAILIFTTLEMMKFLPRIWQRFTAVPGPLLAKLTVLWKFFHLWRGTYESAVKKLHQKHGDVVQVGPYEYSVWNVRFFERCSKLQKADPPSRLLNQTIPTDTIAALHDALKMANVFAYEPDINACNYKLLETLARYAETGEDVRFADLIANYAYDVLFATSTGQRAGFLDKPQDAAKISESLSDWKLYSILYGSYLRFHPLIDRVVRLFTWQKRPEDCILETLAAHSIETKQCVANIILKLQQQSGGSAKSVQEACAALIVAGADPAITHMLSSLYYVYRDPELLVKLRQEIERANLQSPATFKELIHSKPKMPLLHAVMNESLRLHQPATTGFSYVTPAGGITIDGKHVPGDCTICLQPSMAQVNPAIFGADAEIWKPQRWIDHSLKLPQIRGHMRAIIPNFDITMSGSKTYTTTPVKMTLEELKECFVAHVKIPKNVSVIITPQSPLRATAAAFAPETTTAPEVPPGLTPRKITFSREECAPASGFDGIGKYVTALQESKEFVPSAANHGEDTPAKTTVSTSPTMSSATTLHSETPARFEDVETLEYHLGREITTTLLKNFDPSQKELQPARAVKSPMLRGTYQRAMVHEATERIWGDRLSHRTDTRSQCIWFSLPRNNATARTNTKVGAKDATRGRPNDRPATAPVRARTPPPVHAGWGAFANVEKAAHAAKVAEDEESAKTEASFAKAQEQRKKWQADLEAQSKAMADNTVLRSTFKQTNGRANGTLSGARKFTSTIKTDENGETVIDSDSDNNGGATIEKPVVQRKAALPPHLRNKRTSTTDAAPNDSAIDVPAKTETASAKVTDTAEWVAARLPVASI